MEKIKELKEVSIKKVNGKNKKLVLFNDDFNTFEFVIESLMEVCGHTYIQATQCTYLVHYKGKCEVKFGELEKLLPKKNALINRGLSAEIQ